MTIRIIQVNYLKLVKGIDIRDPEKIDVKAETASTEESETRP
jgi:hypothetical protein